MNRFGTLLCVAMTLLALKVSALEVVSLSGTSYTEQEFETGRFRVKTSSLTLKSLYAAYGVSSADYLLDCNPWSTNVLVLQPRFNNPNLSPIVLLQAQESSARVLRDWHEPSHPRSELPLQGPSSSGALFNEFRGTMLGRIGRSTAKDGILSASYDVLGSSATHQMKFHFTISRGSGATP